MSTNAENKAGALDWLKWLIVAALLAGGVFANWYYQDEMLLVRVAGLLTTAAAAPKYRLRMRSDARFTAMHGRSLPGMARVREGMEALERLSLALLRETPRVTVKVERMWT